MEIFCTLYMEDRPEQGAAGMAVLVIQEEKKGEITSGHSTNHVDIRKQGEAILEDSLDP